jgi:hypothetical protein
MKNIKKPILAISEIHCGYPPLMAGFNYRKSDYRLEFYKGGGIVLYVGGYLPNLLDNQSDEIPGGRSKHRFIGMYYSKTIYAEIMDYLKNNNDLFTQIKKSKALDSRVGGTIKSIMYDGTEYKSYDMPQYFKIQDDLFAILKEHGLDFDDNGSVLNSKDVSLISETKSVASLFEQ